MPTKVAAPTSRPKIKLTKLFIDNKWVDPVDGGEFETYNPATGEVIANVAAGSAADVDKAVKAARRALESGPWSTMDAGDRGRLLFKLADLVEQNAAELASLESLNCGKTITDSKGDIGGVVNSLRYYAGWADKIEGRTVPVRGSFGDLMHYAYVDRRDLCGHYMEYMYATPAGAGLFDTVPRYPAASPQSLRAIPA